MNGVFEARLFWPLALAAILLAIPSSVSAQGDGPGEDCFTCFAEVECWISGCFPVSGTVDCVDAQEGDGETAGNCTDDELNTMCSIEGFEDCEQVLNEEDALAFLVLPGVEGAQGSVVRVQDMVYCATGEVSGVQVLDSTQ